MLGSSPTKGGIEVAVNYSVDDLKTKKHEILEVSEIDDSDQEEDFSDHDSDIRIKFDKIEIKQTTSKIDHTYSK